MTSPAVPADAAVSLDGGHTQPSPTKRWLRYLLLFVPHVVVAPLALFLVVTFLHELAHAGCALALGAKVTQFAFLPVKGGPLGQMSWDPPRNAIPHFADWVALAPYVMWSTCIAAVVVIAALPQRLHRWFAAFLFLWLYTVPLGDIAWNLLSTDGDLAYGFVWQVLALGGCGVVWAVGHLVQRRLFHEHAVGVVGYVGATVVVGGALGGAALLGLWILQSL